MSDDNSNGLPTKPSFIDWLESILPFKLPRIPLPQTAKNFDKAAARLITAGLGNLSQRLDASSRRIAARSRAEITLIDRAKQYLSTPDIAPDLRTRALEHALGDALIEQSNREKILELTADDLSKDKPTAENEDAQTEIDSDWLNLFTRRAETKSNNDVQKIWARILASEIRKPGSTSLRTLDFLSSIDATGANRIVNAFSFVINNDMVPRFSDQKSYMDYNELLFLQEVGIITGSFGVGGTVRKLGSNDPSRYINYLWYFQKAAALDGPNPESIIDVPAHPLTAVGRELYAISETKTPRYDFFLEFCKGLPKGELAEIYIADVVSIEDLGVRVSNKQVIFPEK